MYLVSPRLHGMQGMGFPNIAVAALTPPFTSLLENKLLNNSVFSFWLNSNSEAQVGGELVLGGVDPAHFTGPRYWTDLSQVGYWQFAMSSAQVQGTSLDLCSGGCQAIADTGADHSLLFTICSHEEVQCTVYSVLRSWPTTGGIDHIVQPARAQCHMTASCLHALTAKLQHCVRTSCVRFQDMTQQRVAGTSLITGPSSQIAQLNQLIGAQSSSGSAAQIDCGAINQLPAVDFKLAGATFQLAASDYILQVGLLLVPEVSVSQLCSEAHGVLYHKICCALR